MSSNRMVPSSTAAAAVAVTVVAAAASWAWLRQQRRPHEEDDDEKNSEDFHVDYPRPELPMALRIIAKLPRFVRRPLLVKANAPKVPLDGVDVGVRRLSAATEQDDADDGACYNPYEYKELVPGKLWRVRYSFVPDPALHAAMKDMFGIDMADRDNILKEISDPKLQKALEQQLDVAEEFHHKYDHLLVPCKGKNSTVQTKKNLEEYIRRVIEEGLEDSQDMLVVRLNDKSSGEEDSTASRPPLLIYNACRMRQPVIDFLQTKGVVKYIVSGSSVHTNQVPQASATFPDAKIVCAKSAEEKCRAVGANSCEYMIYTDHEERKRNGFEAIQEELGRFGVQVFHVQGDVMTQSLLLVAHGHLLDTDLSSYGNGSRWFHTEEKDWIKGARNVNWVQICYYAAVLHSSVPVCVRGYLPSYRVMGMDPSSTFSKLMLDEPTKASCREMAHSLRTMLKTLEFDWVDCVHSKRHASVPAVEFRDMIRRAWSWLDAEGLMSSS